MGAKTILAIIVIVAGATLHRASNWWERAYATHGSSEISPDGCIRIDTYSPFRVLPSVFHRIPDLTFRYGLGREWDAPMFKRAYEVRTGAFLGETIVFDASSGPDSSIYWNAARKPGRRIVLANGFPLVDSDRCADEATLAKLEAFYERERESNRAMEEAWEEDRKHPKPPLDSNP